ncbi:MAG: glycosyltransferase family 1 protein [Solirubrobacterales bacterium]|nr:glycosyltransferase family 1 protein [Solirubrobacterales bacterium]
MRIICSTTPMDGALGPFIPLGHALARRGHDVVVATGDNLRDRVIENGFEFVPAGLSAMDGVLRAREDGEVLAAPPGDRIAFPAAMFGSVHPRAKLSTLRELAGSRPPELVVHPPVDLAGPLLAAELGTPSVCYGFGQPFDPQVLASMGRRVRPLWEEAGVDPDPHGGIYRGRYLDPRPPKLGDEGIVSAAAASYRIRPEIPGASDASLPAWAGELPGHAVIYVSLGTAPLFNQPAKFAPLLGGLASEAVEVVVTVSELNDPAALGEQPSNVHVERWLPLAPLLRRCDAVLCHAGTGTTLAALAAGLPMVLVPQGADQFDNARACERAGAARVLLPGEVTADSIKDAVRSVLAPDSPERAAARDLAEEIASMPSAATVAEDLESTTSLSDAREVIC